MSVLGKLAFWKHDEGKSDSISHLGTGHDRAGVGRYGDGLGDLNSHDGLGDIKNSLSNIASKRNFGPNPNLEPVVEEPYSSNSPFDKLSQSMKSTPVPAGNDLSRSIEIISSKIDTVKAMLESLIQRVEKIERIAESDQSNQQQRYRYH